ncbi:L-fucose mutarotase [Arthrobacter woluwensis]|uniref:RbsD/FucU domain-containing protein n=1 Tax=Arthrobacter woluwensis TaxID=156980 RepID=UPI002783603D|nr:RbsD/FucU domain-containing protein [Arthrobacter woluwensis]MDQ0710102.1 L-fucose mutarotase [Arthrobacter woluwensis]
MIRGSLKHPVVLAALAGAGHKSTVLIADLNYAASTAVAAGTPTVHLALTAGTPTVPEVLDVVQGVIPVEHATQIRPSEDALPSPVQDEVRTLLGVAPELVSREDFYRLARSEDLALAIITGDTRRFGNVLLRIGALTEPPY